MSARLRARLEGRPDARPRPRPSFETAALPYVDEYKLLTIAALAVIPLLVAFKKPPSGRSTDHTLALE